MKPCCKPLTGRWCILKMNHHQHTNICKDLAQAFSVCICQLTSQQTELSAGSTHLQMFHIEKKWSMKSGGFIIGLPTPDLSEYSSTVMLCTPSTPRYNCLP